MRHRHHHYHHYHNHYICRSFNYGERTDDDVFTLIFDEEREEIIMRWNSAKLIKTPHAHTHTERKNTVDEKQKKNAFSFCQQHVQLLHTAYRFNWTSLNRNAAHLRCLSTGEIFNHDFLHDTLVSSRVLFFCSVLRLLLPIFSFSEREWRGRGLSIYLPLFAWIKQIV